MQVHVVQKVDYYLLLHFLLFCCCKYWPHVGLLRPKLVVNNRV